MESNESKNKVFRNKYRRTKNGKLIPIKHFTEEEIIQKHALKRITKEALRYKTLEDRINTLEEQVAILAGTNPSARVMNFEYVIQDTWKNAISEFIAKYDNVRHPILEGLQTRWLSSVPADLVDLPKRATACSAGYDVESPITFTAYPGEHYFLPLGIKCQLQPNYVLMMFPRSSMGNKYGLRLENTVGVIDADYYNNIDNEGHIFISFTVNREVEITAGTRIAQLVAVPYGITETDNVSTLRTGGWGSTPNKDGESK